MRAVFFVGMAACAQPVPSRSHDVRHSPDHCPLCHMYSRVKHGVVRISTPEGTGAGSFVNPRGWVITHRHVVGSRDSVEVTLFDGRTLKGRVSRRGESVDLALVEIEEPSRDWPSLPLAPDGVEEGEEISVIGHPLDLRWTMMRGIISRIRRYDDPKMPDSIQIDAPIGPGNSGGPVLTRDGRVIGVVTSKVTAFGAENLGFACPAKKIVEFLEGREP